MALNFTWQDFWAYHDGVEDALIKAHLQEEVIGDGWLARQPSGEQIKALENAPKEFVDKVIDLLKPEAQIKFGVNPYLHQWQRR